MRYDIVHGMFVKMEEGPQRIVDPVGTEVRQIILFEGMSGIIQDIIQGDVILLQYLWNIRFLHEIIEDVVLVTLCFLVALVEDIIQTMGKSPMRKIMDQPSYLLFQWRSIFPEQKIYSKRMLETLERASRVKLFKVS